jgi:hypothetical protein
LKAGYKYPCPLCGLPTTSALGVCNRLGTPCRREYQRRERALFKERRNRNVRRYYRKQRGVHLVYAVWLPAAGILKVGFTLNKNSSIFAGNARRSATKRGYDTDGSCCIWHQDGDTRVEAWMQASLAFRWRRAYEKGNRICEWFLVPGLAEDEMVKVLDEVYGLMPPDLTGEASEVGLPPGKESAEAAQLPMF